MRTAVLSYLSFGRQKGLALRGSYVSDCLINRIKLIFKSPHRPIDENMDKSQ